MNSLVHYIYFIMLYGTVVSFIIQRKQQTPALKLLFIYFLLYTCFNTAGMVLQLLHFRNNLFLYRILTPVEYTFLGLMYYQLLENRSVKLAVLWSIAAFFVTCILLTVFVESWLDNDSSARSLEALLITIWILVYLKQILTTNKILTMHQDPIFWISMGYLTYFIGVLFIQGPLNQLIREGNGVAGYLYRFQYLFEYSLFIQINIALFCHRIFSYHL